jgi:hypothetical protein
MTRILISAALETDWEDGEEWYVAHAGDVMQCDSYGID